MIICRSCGKSDFEDYNTLAMHIMASKKGHFQSKKWAAKVLMQVSRLNKKKEFENRPQLTEEEKENKRDSRRELSGKTEVVNTYCPRCKTKTRQRLEVEFIQSGQSWGIGNYFIVLCPLCTRR